MIDTIFYFLESLPFDEYITKFRNGEISNRTIVFAENQKAIYKGGTKYGGISVQEFNEKVEELYDDSWIKDEIDGIKNDILASTGRINGLNDLVQILNGRLDDLINGPHGIDDQIEDKVTELFNDEQWLQENFNQGVVEWKEGWDAKIGQYLGVIGYWDVDDYGNRVAKWSKLLSQVQDNVATLTASVNSLVTNGNLSTALSSTIMALVNGKLAELSLDSTYSKIEDVNNTKQVIEWMYAALKTSASQGGSFAQILASGKNGMNDAIADIRTYVQRLENGDYVAETELSAKVNNVISSLILQSSDSNVVAGMSAKIDANSDNISAILLSMTGSSSTADIQTRISNRLSGFISTADLNAAKSEIYSAIGAYDPTDPNAQNNQNLLSLASIKTQVDTNTASISAISQASQQQSGFVSKAELGSAVAELFASSGQAQSPTAKASVVALVKDNKSSLELNAEDVNINGYLNGGSATFKGDINASSFVTGDADESGISVMSGDFDENVANTHKAYFAYDSSQGAMTLWFYQNGAWKSMDLSKIVYNSGAGAQEQFYTRNVCQLDSENITRIPTNTTIFQLYESKTSGKWYTSPDSTSAVAEGTYYMIASGNIGAQYNAISDNTFGGYISIIPNVIDGIASVPIIPSGTSLTVTGTPAHFDDLPPAETFQTAGASSAYCSQAVQAYKIYKIVIDNTGAVTSKKGAIAYYHMTSLNTYNNTNSATVEPCFLVYGNQVCVGSQYTYIASLNGLIIDTKTQNGNVVQDAIVNNARVNRLSVVELPDFAKLTSMVPVTLAEALAWTTPQDYIPVQTHVFTGNAGIRLNVTYQ